VPSHLDGLLSDRDYLCFDPLPNPPPRIIVGGDFGSDALTVLSVLGRAVRLAAI